MPNALDNPLEPEDIFNSPTYASQSAVKNTLHGTMYQLKLSTLLLLRAISDNYAFCLATEMEAAEKFDDIVLKKQKSDASVQYRFFQFKHSALGNTKITSSDFLADATKQDNDFSLQKYFISYREIKKKINLNGDINFIILSNKKLDITSLASAQITLKPLALASDKLYDLTIGEIIPQKFNLEISESHNLYKKLEKCSDQFRLAELLAEYVISGKKIAFTEALFKEYHQALIAEKIIDPLTRKLHENFINSNGLSGRAAAFREIFFEKYRNSKALFDDGVVKIELSILILNLSDNFLINREGSALLPEEDIKLDIDKFLKEFILSVGNPGENHINQLISQELHKNYANAPDVAALFNLIDSDFLVSHLQKIMLDWLKEKGITKGQEGRFLTEIQGREFITELQQKINQLVLISPTIEYEAKLKATKFRFKPEVIARFDDLLSSSKKVIYLVNEKKTYLLAIKLYQYLKEKADYSAADSYIFINVKQATSLKARLLEAVSSSSYKLVIIDCKALAISSLQGLLAELIAKIPDNSIKKLILISSEKKSIVPLITSTVEIDNTNIEELDAASQESFFAKEVNFQGNTVVFETLLDEQAKKVLDFTDLIANWDHYPKVGEALVLPTTYRKDVHIERKLKKIYLDRSIFKSKPTNDKFLITGIYNKIPPYFLYDFLDLDAFFEDTSRSSRIFFTNGDVLEGKVHDLWATLKKIDPYANLHVLDYDLEKLQWKKSYGDLSFVRNFLKTDDENYYSKRYLIDKKNLYNYFVLSDKPGMGKTHFLSFLANYYKRFYPSVWVVNQNLNACIQSLEQIEALRPLALGENTYTKGIVIDFLQQVMRLNTDFEKKLFSHYLNTNKVILLFDGFDEMTHRHQQIFIEILKILKEFNIKLLGVTTRPFYQIQLEEALACFSFALTSFSRADQISLITKIWLSDSKNLVAANHLVQKAAIFSNKLVQDLQLPHDAESSLMAIPLQVYLLACQFKEKFWDSIESDSMQRLDIHTDLLKLYRYFIDETYRIYYEKLGWDSSYKERIREEILRFNQQLELMAIRQLFPEFQEAILDALGVEFEYLIPNEALKSLGFISIYDNKIFFIHKNFLEYFASQWLIKNLHHVKLDKLVTDILKKIVNSAEVSYIRLFFDFSLQKPLLHDYILNKRTKLQDYFATTAEVFFNSVDAVGRTALHIAALYNSDKISLLLENGLDLRKKDNLDWTALDYAIAIKNWDAVNNLAKKYLGLTGPFSELSEKVFLQEHFLHVAARRNWKILIELAVKVTPSDKKLDLINHANAEGDTALHIAARYGWVEFADLLFQQGAYDRPNENANTAMDIAAEAGQVNFIAFLFEKRELLDGRRDYYQIQHSPLISAVQENGLSTVQYLLNKHVDLTTADSKGNTALHLAALLDNEIILAVLLNEYAKVDVKNLDGQTPLHYAAERGNIKSMQRLLAKGADLYLKQKDGDTPLHLMLLSLLKKEHEKLAYIKTLLARPATDVEIVGMEGNHLLHYAAGEGNSELIRYLLDIKNGEIDPKNFYGFTPLFFAVKEGHEEAMDFLLERNADIFQKDSNGETVAHLAAYRGHLSILKKLLQKKPALINSRNKKGNSILDLAIRTDHSEVADYLKEKYGEQSKPVVLEAVSAGVKRSLDDVVEMTSALKKLRTAPFCMDGDVNTRRRRGVDCQESSEEAEYEPIDEFFSDLPVYRAHFFSLFSLMLRLKRPERFEQQEMSLNSWLEYHRNIAKLIEEGPENHSPREKNLLQMHYREARFFFDCFDRNNLLNSVETLSANPPVFTDTDCLLCDNGRELVLIFYQNGRYQLYSPDINYIAILEWKEETDFLGTLRLVEKFFSIKSGSKSYSLFRLKNDLPEALFLVMKLANFWHPSKFLADSVLLDRESGLIEGIPKKIVHELLRVKGKKPELSSLHADFFKQHRYAISLSIENLPQYVLQLSPEENKKLLVALKKYNWPIDVSYLKHLRRHEYDLLKTYQEQLLTQLKNAEVISVQQLSAISWNVLEAEFAKLDGIEQKGSPQAIAAQLHTHSQLITRAGIQSGLMQGLFFLPDMIRAGNGDWKPLAANIGLTASDMGFDAVYPRLLKKITPLISEQRANRLNKLPITSPILKGLTIFSIFELTQELKTVPPSSDRHQDIRRSLMEEYFTVGLIAAEMFGFEVTAPLWMALMGEQLLFSAQQLQRDNQFNISLWQAFLMSLGFKQKQLNVNIVFSESRLLEENFADFTLSNRSLFINFAWLLLKVPKLGQVQEVSIAEESISTVQKALVLQGKVVKEALNRYKVFENAAFSFVEHYKIKRMGIGETKFGREVLQLVVDRREWKKKLYPVMPAMSVWHFYPISNLHQEATIFSADYHEEKITFHRTASVFNVNSPFRADAPVLIEGGAAALYMRIDQTAKRGEERRLFFVFDGREGDALIKFTPEGLKALDKINYDKNNSLALNVTDPYYLIVQIKEKKYNEHVVFPNPSMVTFILNDLSKRLVSSYFIDSGSLNATIKDNVIASHLYIRPAIYDVASNLSALTLLNGGYAKILISTYFISELARFDSSYLTPVRQHQFYIEQEKEYLQLNLGGCKVDRDLLLKAAHLNVSDIQGLFNTSKIVLHPAVNIAEMHIRGDIIIADREVKLSIQGMLNESQTMFSYFRYRDGNQNSIYQLKFDNLTEIVNTLQFHEDAVVKFQYQSLACQWQPSAPDSFIVLELQGPIGLNQGYLSINKAGCCLKIVDGQQKLIHIENTYFQSTPGLTEELPLQGIFYKENSAQYQFTSASNKNISFHEQPVFRANQFLCREEAPVLAFYAEGYPVLHRFLHEKRIELNQQAYCVSEGKLLACAEPEHAIDAAKLLYYVDGKRLNRIPIFINITLRESKIEKDKQDDTTLTINAVRLYHLKNNQQLIFFNQSYPVNLIRDALNAYSPQQPIALRSRHKRATDAVQAIQESVAYSRQEDRIEQLADNYLAKYALQSKNKQHKSLPIAAVASTAYAKKSMPSNSTDKATYFFKAVNVSNSQRAVSPSTWRAKASFRSILREEKCDSPLEGYHRERKAIGRKQSEAYKEKIGRHFSINSSEPNIKKFVQPAEIPLLGVYEQKQSQSQPDRNFGVVRQNMNVNETLVALNVLFRYMHKKEYRAPFSAKKIRLQQRVDRIIAKERGLPMVNIRRPNP